MSALCERAVVFACGDARLIGVLHEPPVPGADHGIVIVVGGPQYRVGSHRQFVLMARELAAAGYPVMRFDYRGMGDSEGDARNFEVVDADLRAAVDTLLGSAPQVRKVILWGLCDAASACFMYAQSDSRIAGMIVANPWVHTEAGAATAYMKRYYGRRFLQRSFWTKVLSGQFDVLASAGDFLTKLRRTLRRSAPQSHARFFIDRMSEGLDRFDSPVLVLMSENDLVAEEFRGLCTSDSRWKRLMSRPNMKSVGLADADHTFSSRRALVEATAQSLQWLSRHAPVGDARAQLRQA